MNAMVEPVQFQLPKKPRVKPKDAPPDQRRLAVLPIRAGKDQRLHGATLRTLIVLCSYVNRAGLTWVSQAKVAEDLGVSRQAVQKQIALLQATGYIEVVKKGFRGEYSNTLRVIFDEGVDAETAIAITSAQEPTRPPTMDDTPDPAGQRRIAQLIAKALKSPTKKEPTMPKEAQTRTVKAMHQEIEKAKVRRKAAQPESSKVELIRGSDLEKELIKKSQAMTTHTQLLEVANEAVDNSPHIGNLEGLHRQPDRQPPEVAPTGENGIKRELYKDSFKQPLDVLCNLSDEQLTEIRQAGLTDAEAAESLQALLAAYRTEGIAPAPERLASEVIQLATSIRGLV